MVVPVDVRAGRGGTDQTAGIGGNCGDLADNEKVP